MDGLGAWRSLSAQSDSDEEMDLYVKIMKTVPLKLKGSETIKSLKALINEKEGIREKNQDLFFDGNLLSDDQRLGDCGIQRNSTLHLIVQNYVVITVYVKMPNNEGIIKLEARAFDSICNIKSMIQVKKGILSDTFTLVYGGHVLEDDRTLASLNIRNNSTINLVFCQKEVLSVFVKVPSKNIIQLSVKVMFTVNDIKAILGSVIGNSDSNNWYLLYAGKLLEDSKTLAFYDIKEESLLEFSPTNMQIFVRTWMGKTLTLNVRGSYTVKDIKANVFQKLKIPIHLQSIVYAGKRLEDNNDLASYRIQRHSTLHMVFAPSSKFVKMRLSSFGPNLPATTDIRSLKVLIQEKIPEVKEVLFKGKPLQDEHTLGHYKIWKDAELDVVF